MNLSVSVPPPLQVGPDAVCFLVVCAAVRAKAFLAGLRSTSSRLIFSELIQWTSVCAGGTDVTRYSAVKMPAITVDTAVIVGELHIYTV